MAQAGALVADTAQNPLTAFRAEPADRCARGSRNFGSAITRMRLRHADQKRKQNAAIRVLPGAQDDTVRG